MAEEPLATVGDIISFETHDGMTIRTNVRSEDELKESDARDAEANPSKERVRASKAGAELAAAKKAKEKQEAKDKAEPEKPAEDEKKAAEGAPEAKKEPEKEPEKTAKADEKDDPDESDEDKAKRKGNPRHDPIARMKEATRREAELKRQLRERDAEIARLKSAPAKPAKKAQDGEPNPSDYGESQEEVLRFIDDRAAWRVRQEIEQREAAREKSARESAERERTAKTTAELDRREESFRAKLQSAREADPGLPDRVREVANLLSPTWNRDERGTWSPAADIGPLNLLADEVMFRAEDPVALLEYLAQNPDALQRIAAAENDREFHRELANLNHAVAATAVPAPRVARTSKAHPPAEPVKGSPSATDPLEITGKESFAEYLKKMNEREDRERKRRQQV